MTKLIVMRGLPASGKSTWAKNWVDQCPTNRVRVNKDDLRLMAHGRAFYDEPDISRYTEKSVHEMCYGLTDVLLRKKVDVVVDNTNLQSRTVRSYRDLAMKHNADFEVKDLTHVDVKICLRRDIQRDDSVSVGADVITGFYNKFIKGQPYPLPVWDGPVIKAEVDPAPFVPVPYTPETVICDVDGTVALMQNRSPYDFRRVREDLPNWPVIDNVEVLAAAGFKVLFLSARKEICREDTEKWLQIYMPISTHYLSYEGLYMREDNDNRKDNLVKLELFDDHIRNRYNVKYVFDDRDQVVRLWRKLGLPTFQVAEGDF